MSERAQLVLIASVVITVAIIPIAFAYLQLGYDGDVEATATVEDPEGDAHRVLVRAVHNASNGIPGQYAWTNRTDAVDAVRSNLEPRIESVETGLVDQGIARNVSYNRSAASAWAGADCPSGPDRQFGDCEADRGVVVQERAGRSHVLRVALDLETTTDRRESSVTWIVDAW